ncbi:MULTISPECIES: cytochrome P450 [Streptomyces]|uniref:AbsX n=1 Tax=Streptomyces sp. LC-6-2 TaxID=1676287 RepID=A0A1V0QH72_9ACTN|nr:MULTISPECIES: cytochrome P450 [Streptomyces]ARE67841.1 AbsX [Streptomyces sp. LC-6-2]NED35675.1 cytochrome P450 [Streptomyces sp. SID8499]NED72184.1 cytochrome P450 [Streptomyces sp. SID9944]EFF94135.1 cytochrome P450-SU1 [Streptomyces sp. e14]MBY8867816.1 cytochrome P450 [Streptomyces sennicomposti]
MLSYPQDRTCPYQPSPGYRELGRSGPLHKVRLWDGSTIWMVTGHAAGRRLLADPRLSADRSRPDFPVVLPRFEAPIFKPIAIIGFDPPVHDVHRRMLAPDFSLKHVREMRDEVVELTGRLVDDMLRKGPPAELVEDFALPIPSMVISQLLGVPYEDHVFFEEKTVGLLQAKDAAGAEAAGQALWDYLDELISAKERTPGGGEGVLGRLAGRIDDRDLTREDLLRIALALLIGGHDTTSQMIALGVVTLLEHPDQLAAWRAAPPEALPAAVDELLRMVSVTDVSGVRVATEDIEIDGEVVRAGEGVLVSSSMTNRDPEVYEDPYTFDIHRAAGRGGAASGRQHLTFGFGIHQCLGQNLARMELEVAFSTLFDRIPGLRLATPAGELPARSGGTMQGVHRLPVEW